MRIGNSVDTAPKLDTNLANEMLKKKLGKKDEKDDKDKTPTEVLAEVKSKNLKQLLKGKSGKVIEELGKQKITPNNLHDAIDKLKKQRDDDKKTENKKDDDKKEIDVKDKNRDGKVSEEEKTDAKKKTLSLVKDLVGELKKDDNIKDLKSNDIKNVSKLLNNEILDKKEASKVNKFLDN